jgi:DUF3060 family protein
MKLLWQNAKAGDKPTIKGQPNMKTLTILLLVLAPTLALADKTYQGGKGATWNCAKDPTVVINHGKGTYTFKGACTSITVNGGANKLTIEAVDKLTLNGAQNTIDLGEVSAIAIVGAANTITWKKARSGDKPEVTVVGTGNKVDQAK